MSLISPTRFQQKYQHLKRSFAFQEKCQHLKRSSAIRSYVSGAAQGFQFNPKPRHSYPIDQALAHDLSMISRDVMKAVQQVATGQLSRFER